MDPADPRYEKSMRFYAHDTTNMLVDARMSLFLIDPKGVIAAQNPDYFRIGELNLPGVAHLPDITEEIAGDPFAGSINFGMLVHDTGGVYFHDRNDVDAEMHVAEELGSDYYTLTYQPPMGAADGKFRHIEVHLRDPNLHAMTKTGYYAPEPLTAADLVPQRVNPMDEISEAAQSSVVFDSLGVSIVHVVRHPDQQHRGGDGAAEIDASAMAGDRRWTQRGQCYGGGCEPFGTQRYPGVQVREIDRAIQQSGCRTPGALQHIRNSHGASAAPHADSAGGDPGR